MCAEVGTESSLSRERLWGAPTPTSPILDYTGGKGGKRRREAVSGFCLNVGLCCVNKFKVEGAKLGVVVEGRRKALAV